VLRVIRDDRARPPTSVARHSRRLRQRRASRNQAEMAERLTTLVAELRRDRGYAERLLVKHDGRIRFVPVAELV
jgi:hypothetical protein